MKQTEDVIVRTCCKTRRVHETSLSYCSQQSQLSLYSRACLFHTFPLWLYPLSFNVARFGAEKILILKSSNLLRFSLRFMPASVFSISFCPFFFLVSWILLSIRPYLSFPFHLFRTCLYFLSMKLGRIVCCFPFFLWIHLNVGKGVLFLDLLDYSGKGRSGKEEPTDV